MTSNQGQHQENYGDSKRFSGCRALGSSPLPPLFLLGCYNSSVPLLDLGQRFDMSQYLTCFDLNPLDPSLLNVDPGSELL